MHRSSSSSSLAFAYAMDASFQVRCTAAGCGGAMLAGISATAAPHPNTSPLPGSHIVAAVAGAGRARSSLTAAQLLSRAFPSLSSPFAVFTYACQLRKQTKIKTILNTPACLTRSQGESALWFAFCTLRTFKAIRQSKHPALRVLRVLLLNWLLLTPRTTCVSWQSSAHHHCHHSTAWQCQGTGVFNWTQR